MEPEAPTRHRQADHTDAFGADDPTGTPDTPFEAIPDGYSPRVAECFAHFGDHYDELCAELFTNDPVLGIEPPVSRRTTDDIAITQDQPELGSTGR